MERESKLTTRQAWEVTAELRQNEVNELLGDLQTDIELINTNIANHDGSSNMDELRQYAAEAVSYLNEKWQLYLGAAFLVAGDWYGPYLEYGPNNVKCTHIKAEFFEILYSEGFTVALTPTSDGQEGDTESVNRVGMSFTSSGSLNIDSPWMSAEIHPRYFAELHEVSLQYIRPASLDAISSDLSEVTDSIDRIDSLLKLHLTHEGSNFYQISAKKQQDFLRSMIDSIHEVLPLPETRDQIRVHQAVLSEFYIRNFNGKQGISRLRPEGGSIEMSGSVRGATVLGSLSDSGEKIESPDELLEAGKSISLIISPLQLSHGIPDYEGEDIIVPLSQLESGSFELF